MERKGDGQGVRGESESQEWGAWPFKHRTWQRLLSWAETLPGDLAIGVMRGGCVAEPCQTPASPSAPWNLCLFLLVKVKPNEQLRSKELLFLPTPAPSTHFSASAERSRHPELKPGHWRSEEAALLEASRNPDGWRSLRGWTIPITDKAWNRREF